MNQATAALQVPDMTCGHCKASIEGALKELGGMSDIAIDLDTKAVQICFDADVLSLDAIVNAIEGQGFDVTQT